MARKNRLVVNDGVYHVTTRVANRAFLFRDDELKDRIVDWLYGIADFSGVDVLAWCVMENHLHIMVRVPNVPERYWLKGDCPPSPAAFTLRPSECTPPRWFPESSAGDSPSARFSDFGDCPRPRPPVGFMLSDDEMIVRLGFLYGKKVAETKARHWNALREQGRGSEVDEEKERYCRRMYNISQFVKTLKERIAMRYNSGNCGSRRRSPDATGPSRPRHCGHLFEGRFYSSMVDRNAGDYGTVAAYIAVNPVKARLASSADGWRWSSFACAVRGDSPLSERCRKAYSEMLGCTWEEAKARMEKLTSDRLPEGFDAESGSFSHSVTGEDGKVRSVPLRVTQAIWLKVRAFTQGAIVSRDPEFARKIYESHPKRFPHQGDWSVEFCQRLDWTAA